MIVRIDMNGGRRGITCVHRTRLEIQSETVHPVENRELFNVAKDEDLTAMIH
jgi:hypothetical protein